MEVCASNNEVVPYKVNLSAAVQNHLTAITERISERAKVFVRRDDTSIMKTQISISRQKIAMSGSKNVQDNR